MENYITPTENMFCLATEENVQNLKDSGLRCGSSLLKNDNLLIIQSEKEFIFYQGTKYNGMCSTMVEIEFKENGWIIK